MNRRKFIRKMSVGAVHAVWAMATIALSVTAHASEVSSEIGNKKPNIIFIFADQLRSHGLGCYGNDQLSTPNLDRLAKEGAKFTNAISTVPACSPFRAMLMTGNYPMKNGMVINDHFLRNPTPYFAQACKSAGYRTGFIGKWHLDGYGRTGHIPPERRCGFDYWRTLECTHNYFDSKYYHQDEKTTRTWPSYDAVDQTDEACKYIASAKPDHPFCLFLAWGPPHSPYVAPAEYMSRFANKDIKMRKNVNDFKTAEKMWRESNTEIPEKFERYKQKRLAKMKDRDNVGILKDYRGYYAAIETLDDCMGKIVAQLKKTGQLDNTIIVFTSDHGDNLGSHRQAGKMLPFEESISIPFIIRYPKKIKTNTKTDALLAPIDMMPTVLALAGVQCPKVDGKNISAAAMGNVADMQDAVLIMKTIPLSINWIVNGNGAWRGVRTKRYTYARQSDTKKPWMLFDNEKDPYQLKNLVDDPAYSSLLKKLDNKTNQLLTEAGDPEDPAIYAKLIQKERNDHGVVDRWKDLMPGRVKPGEEFGH